jgi:hypothetical protein
MSSVVLTGDTSGSGTITVPAVAGTFTATMGSATGTHYPFTSGTAVASTSGTSIDFTSIPSWVKRITVMMNGVSISGTSNIILQLGAGSITTSGYSTGIGLIYASTAALVVNYTNGFNIALPNLASDLFYGSSTLSLFGSNTWVGAGNMNSAGRNCSSSGLIALGGTLDRIRITTANGTDTFDAGSINILYE